MDTVASRFREEVLVTRDFTLGLESRSNSDFGKWFMVA